MEATHEIEKPLLCPNSFAGVMMSAERFIVEVWWERGMVSETHPFLCNRFLGCRDYHVYVILQCVRRIASGSVSLKGSREKVLNRCGNPIEETVLAGK